MMETWKATSLPNPLIPLLCIYVDFIFYPIRESDDAIIFELKVDHTPEEAIAQIKEKEYALRLKGKLAAKICSITCVSPLLPRHPLLLCDRLLGSLPAFSRFLHRHIIRKHHCYLIITKLNYQRL